MEDAVNDDKSLNGPSPANMDGSARPRWTSWSFSGATRCTGGSQLDGGVLLPHQRAGDYVQTGWRVPVQPCARRLGRRSRTRQPLSSLTRLIRLCPSARRPAGKWSGGLCVAAADVNGRPRGATWGWLWQRPGPTALTRCCGVSGCLTSRCCCVRAVWD